jgi:hypothetical protein
MCGLLIFTKLITHNGKYIFLRIQGLGELFLCVIIRNIMGIGGIHK